MRKARKTDIGTKATTAADNTPTQGGEENISALVAASESSGAPSTVGDSDNVLTDDIGKLPIPDIAVCPSQIYFYYMGGDENIDVSVGALETGIQRTTILDGESALSIDPGGSPSLRRSATVSLCAWMIWSHEPRLVRREGIPTNILYNIRRLDPLRFGQCLT
ncbi:hypothetical protein Cgig2_007571 [Carnegiea gigantea]|uniref:Uncharacterized protein n=1 Tax=Carnegiea gigantea TaxID=171969 RepID=A0A9Q1GJT4_9CARY|nr:hypothetical protein Cgig2_007571 [Carnegiea gigantea]